MRPKLLIIGHADSTGRSGLAADMRAAETLGVEPLPVITSFAVGTDDHPEALKPVWYGTIKRQLDAALALQPEAALVGVISRPRHVRMITEQLVEKGPAALVVAPLPGSFDIEPLIGSRLFPTLRKQLLPQARVVVLPAANAAALVGGGGDTPEALRTLGQQVIDLGANTAWIRALRNEARRVDVIVDQDGPGLLNYQPASGDAEPHTSAASLAALLALGTKVREAIERAHRHAYALDRDVHAV